MSALAIVTKKLTTYAALNAVVPAGSVHSFEAPQGLASPYIVLNLVSESDEQMLRGAAAYFDSRVQVECIDASGTKANNIGELVKMALQNVVKENITVGATVFQGVDIYKADSDLTDRSDDRSVSRRIMDFYVRWHGAL